MFILIRPSCIPAPILDPLSSVVSLGDVADVFVLGYMSLLCMR
jgi:hypothetical protein